MLTAFLVGPDRVLWLWMPVKKECLGLDCIIITLGVLRAFCNHGRAFRWPRSHGRWHSLCGLQLMVKS